MIIGELGYNFYLKVLLYAIVHFAKLFFFLSEKTCKVVKFFKMILKFLVLF